MTDKEENEESGTHEDNNLSRVQQIMKDNNLPFYHSKKQKTEDDETSD